MWCRCSSSGEKTATLELYHDSTVEPFGSAGFDAGRVFGLLEKMRKKGAKVTIYDTVGWTQEMLYEPYFKACEPSVLKKYRIRRVFGTARNSGRFFGRQVPALLVIEGGKVTDIYPHEEKGRMITILEFLETALSQHGG